KRMFFDDRRDRPLSWSFRARSIAEREAHLLLAEILVQNRRVSASGRKSVNSGPPAGSTETVSAQPRDYFPSVVGVLREGLPRTIPAPRFSRSAPRHIGDDAKRPICRDRNNSSQNRRLARTPSC